MTKDLTERFEIDEEYVASSIPFLSTALDPRYSSLKFATSEQRYVAHETIMERLSKFSNGETQESEGEHEEESQEATEKKTALEILQGDISPSQSAVHTPKGELECFEKEVLGPKTNPITWWKANQERYPLLAKLAKQLLCVPATSVPSERVFSMSGTITNAKRNSLKPENLDTLVFLNKNL